MQGKKVKLFIQSDDISLSIAFVETISVHNQLKGRVMEIINGSDVNVGLLLTVEITSGYVKRMKLEVGKEILCLFKSVAVDIVV